jgi:hypothetical protein
MTTDRLDPPYDRPAARVRTTPASRAFITGLVLGLIVGIAIGFFIAGAVKSQPKWTDAGVALMRLPEKASLGPLPQTVTLPAATYDYGGVGAALPPATIDAGSIVKVELKATAGRVGVSLARPDGGELVSREAVVTPQQGKTTLYFRTAPGMGPVDVLLRSADNVAAGAAADISKVQTTPQSSISQREMDSINRAGVY